MYYSIHACMYLSDGKSLMHTNIPNTYMYFSYMYTYYIPTYRIHQFYFAVPPTKIEIEGVKSGSRLSVRENEVVELKCVVHNAKPKALIVWFRENAEFYSGKTA